MLHLVNARSHAADIKDEVTICVDTAGVCLSCIRNTLKTGYQCSGLGQCWTTAAVTVWAERGCVDEITQGSLEGPGGSCVDSTY